MIHTMISRLKFQFQLQRALRSLLPLMIKEIFGLSSKGPRSLV